MQITTRADRQANESPQKTITERSTYHSLTTFAVYTPLLEYRRGSRQPARAATSSLRNRLDFSDPVFTLWRTPDADGVTNRYTISIPPEPMKIELSFENSGVIASR